MQKKIFHKKYLGTPFSIESEEIDNGPNTWKSCKISIYKNDTLIGEYLRNYPSFSSQTFYPFLLKDQWYALYSPHYTATRVMKIHDDYIEDWCGEEASSNGFCPTEYFIPKFLKINYENSETYIHETEYESYEEFEKEVEDTEIQFHKFAFISGCVWGDDYSWKLRYVDLSEIENKKFIVEEKFGYLELPRNLKLKQCINMDNWEPDHNWISLTCAYHVNLSTTKHTGG